MRHVLLASISVSLLLATASDPVRAQGRDGLHIYFIDTEGGQATLFVTPSKESLLIDTGNPGRNNEDRDATRIAETAKKAGLTQIDYVLITHYHSDHVGGLPVLATKIPIKTFVDHGESVEHGERPDALLKAYTDVRDKAKHLLAKPGDTVPIKGLDVRVVSSAGELITKPLPGVKDNVKNALCEEYKPMEADPTENARSLGTMITYGRFRMIDLGDLTWNKEHDLVCPNNLLGTVDVYLTTHHGLPVSGSPQIVHALKPRVAIMNNGATKGGSPQAWQIVHDSPGLEGFWQLHTAVKAGADHNVPDHFIANLDESTGFGITISADRDGGFTVTNERNQQSQSYKARK